MEGPLGQVVFKIPELGKQGYEMEQKQIAKRTQGESKREAENYRTGAQKAYNENSYKLQGRYKEGVELLYSEYEKYATDWKENSNQTSKVKAQEYANEIKAEIERYNTQVGIPLKAAGEADESAWEGYVGDRNSFDDSMSELTASKPQKMENGVRMIMDEGKWIPYNQSDYASQNPNAKNKVMVQKATSLGKFVIPGAWENENSNIGVYSDDPEKTAEAKFKFDLKENLELQTDVAIAFLIKNGELKNNGKVPAEEIVAARRRYDTEPEFQAGANEFYLERIKSLVNIRAKQSRGSSGTRANEINDSEFPKEEAQESRLDNKEGGDILGMFEEENPPKLGGMGVAPPAERTVPVESVAPVVEEKAPVEKVNYEEAEYKISSDINYNPDSVSNVIAHWTTDQGRGKSPITPEMIIGVSNKYNIPVEITMAMLATEGNFGTGKRQKKTNNPFNWGNTTGGDDKTGKEQDKYNSYYDTIEEGIDAWGEGFSRLYRPESGKWSDLWEKEFVRSDGKRYATDKNYEKTIAGIIKNTIPQYAS